MLKFFSKTCFFLVFSLFSCQNEPEKSISKNSSEQKATPDGLAVFRQNCVNCHGIDGRLGLNGAKCLPDSKLSLDERILVISNGRNLMQAWDGVLNPDEIKAVAEFTQTLK